MCHLLSTPPPPPPPPVSNIRLEAGRKRRECKRIEKHVLFLLSASALPAGKTPKLFIRLHAAVCMHSAHSKVTALKHQSEILWPDLRAPSLQIDQPFRPNLFTYNADGSWVDICISASFINLYFSSVAQSCVDNASSPLSYAHFAFDLKFNFYKVSYLLMPQKAVWCVETLLSSGCSYLFCLRYTR